MIPNIVRSFPMRDLPKDFSFIQIDRADTSVGWLGKRQPLYGERRWTFRGCCATTGGAGSGGSRLRVGIPCGSIDICHVGTLAPGYKPDVAHLAPRRYVCDMCLRIV